MLLWSLEEVAHQLGQISIRSVRRMIERGELPFVKIGRRVLIPSEAAREHVAQNLQVAHNSHCAGSAAWKGNNPCHTDAKIRRIGGSNSSTQAAKQLTALLKQATYEKQSPSKPSGNSRRIK